MGRDEVRQVKPDSPGRPKQGDMASKGLHKEFLIVNMDGLHGCFLKLSWSSGEATIRKLWRASSER